MSELELNQLLVGVCTTFPIFMPIENDTFPCIVYSIVATESIESICGVLEEEKRIQVDCYALSYAELLELREQVNAVLSGYERVGDQDNFVEGVDLFRRTLEFYV